MQRFIPSLTSHGLPEDADAVYRALVSDGPARPGELARATGLAPARIAVALERLRDAGIAVAVDEAMWVGKAPREVALVLGGGETVAVLTGEAASMPGVRHLPPAAFERRHVSSAADTHHEYLIIHDHQDFDPDCVRRRLPAMRRMRDRDVALRTVALEGATTPELSRCDFDAVAGEVRRASAVPGNVLVVDHQVALVPHPRGGLEIRDRVLVDALVALHARCWAEATARVRLTARQWAVVSLLFRGHTDESVGRRLNLSRRTVASEVRVLMDLHGASSRLQLGAILAEYWTAA